MKKFDYNDILSGEYITSREDTKIIKKMDNQKVDMTIDNNDKIWTESGIYIADVEKVKY